MGKMNKKEKLLVLAMDEMVMFPEVRTKIKIDKTMGSKLESLGKSDPVFTLALTTKETSSPENESNFYNVGNLVKMESL